MLRAWETDGRWIGRGRHAFVEIYIGTRYKYAMTKFVKLAAALIYSPVRPSDGQESL
jgi:hypothetical protein